MKKHVIRGLILTVVFIAAFLVFSKTTYKDQETQTTVMENASLPTVYFYHGDQKINASHGYRETMNPLTMREGIIPIGASTRLKLEVDTNAFEIDAMEYRVVDSDGREIVPAAQISDYTLTSTAAEASIVLGAELEADTEYTMELTLTSGSEKVYYYTRITLPEDDLTDDYIEAAEEFHEQTFKDDSTYFDDYMETTSGDTTTLNYVDLHCGYTQVAWGSLEVKQESDCTVDIWEVTPHYTVLTLSYSVSAPDAEGNTDYYEVEEYYRLKQGSKRIIVLNFQRTMNQLFTAETADISEDGTINLGIRDTDVEYKSTETGTLAAFVQNGDLWSYDASSGNLTCIFSFRSDEADLQNDYDGHDIRILRVSDGGNVDFLVYGYMNRGSHEGQVGILLVHYDGFVHLAEEQAFIPVKTSPGILMAELDDFYYEDGNSNIYLMLQHDLYQIDLNNRKADLILDGLVSDYYCVSDDCRYIAWIDSQQAYSAETINLMDLENLEISQLEAPNNCYVRPLAFMESDLIYGIAKQADVGTDGSGNRIFPMQTVKIVDISSENYDKLKTFRKSGEYISSITEQGGSIQMNMITLEEDTYVSAGVEAIMDQEYDDGQVLSISSATETDREKVIRLKVNQSSDEITIHNMAVQQVLSEDLPVIELPEAAEKSAYYVYSHGRVLLYTDNYSEAVIAANDAKGMVTDEENTYVWKRDRSTRVSAFQNMAINLNDGMENTLVKSVSAVLHLEGISTSAITYYSEGMASTEILEEKIAGCRAFELEGAEVDDVLSYISQQTPVVAMTGPSQAVVICGYTSDKIYYYDPSIGVSTWTTYAAMNKMCTAGSNKFIVYLK